MSHPLRIEYAGAVCLYIRKEYDHHWNARGHDVAAETIASGTS